METKGVDIRTALEVIRVSLERYNKKYRDPFCEIQLMDDGSGCLESGRTNRNSFDFETLDELAQELEKAK